MYRVFNVLKDTYITDRVVGKQRQYTANVGLAGSLDIFKLYGVSLTGSLSGSVPNNELSRALVAFDISGLQADVKAGRIDITDPSFNVELDLFDVFGGQPTPSNFTIKVYPLSQSFDEGLGRDIVFYQDSDVANFYTASYANGVASTWFASGANAKGLLGSSNIDVIASGNLGAGVVNLWVTQSFPKGTENLAVDVTQIVSATLAGLIPNNGFRVSFDEASENDTKTRFVKRFGSSDAVDPYVHPRLVVRLNDSIVSNASNFTFDSQGSIFLYNFVRGNLVNIVSGTLLTPITGNNCMLLKLVTPVSTSNGFTNYETYVTASQFKMGTTFVTGVYSASFTLPSATPQFITKIKQSGSVVFDEIWSSFDLTTSYFSGSITVKPTQTSTGPVAPRRYYLNVTNVATEYLATDVARMKVFIFDFSNPVITLVKVPLETPSVVVSNAYYAIRDVATNQVIIPFDPTHNSTKLSADALTMYFDLWMQGLIPGRAYVIDIMLVEGGQQQIYRDVSPPFRVVDM